MILLTGFGPFPGIPENATEAIVRSMAAPGIETLVLAVEWARAAETVLEAVRVKSPALLIMSGVARPRHPLWIEPGATSAAGARPDAAGRLPDARAQESALVTIDLERALSAATEAIARVADTFQDDVRFDAIVTGAMIQQLRPENAYVCNDTTFRVCKALRGSTTRVGFLHWPSDLKGSHIAAAAEVLLAVARRC